MWEGPGKSTEARLRSHTAHERMPFDGLRRRALSQPRMHMLKTACARRGLPWSCANTALAPPPAGFKLLKRRRHLTAQHSNCHLRKHAAAGMHAACTAPQARQHTPAVSARDSAAQRHCAAHWKRPSSSWHVPCASQTHMHAPDVRCAGRARWSGTEVARLMC